MFFLHHYQVYGHLKVGHAKICICNGLIYAISCPKVANFAIFACLSSKGMVLAPCNGHTKCSYIQFYSVDSCRTP